MALRQSHGFARYAFAVQYHGLPFLGFTSSGKQEDCILPNGTDLRGFRTVEGRLHEAFTKLVGADNFENIQVSSRTDRGVHALKNTCHVDIRPRKEIDSSWNPQALRKGLNFFLNRQAIINDKRKNNDNDHKFLKRGKIEALPRGIWEHLSGRYPVGMNDVRILSVAHAPRFMENKFAIQHEDQPAHIDWHARFSATQRTYMYRILNLKNDQPWGIPFDWDRSWRLCRRDPLNVEAMKEASTFLIGTHDFSSFRGASCQRSSPIVTVQDIRIVSHPVGELWLGLNGLGIDAPYLQDCFLVTIIIVGESFLYRQVRNMVACLVEVGKGTLTPAQVNEMLAARKRSAGPSLMAPAHGLFLVDVQHGDFKF